MSSVVAGLKILSGPTGASVDSDGDLIELSCSTPEVGAPALVARLKLPRSPANRVWLPHLAPYDGFVIGDHSFRSPAIIVADDTSVLALVPDLDDVAQLQRDSRQAWLDYDHRVGEVSIAVGAYRASGHVLYKPTATDLGGPDLRLRVHILQSSAANDIANPYRIVAAFHWERWGRAGHEAGGAQRASFETSTDHVLSFAFGDGPWPEHVWQRFVIDGTPCAGPTLAVNATFHPSVPEHERVVVERKGVWNQAWFSTQRVANGLQRIAAKRADNSIANEAALATNVALAAPQTDGLFPAVYSAGDIRSSVIGIAAADLDGWEHGQWGNSIRRPLESTGDECHIVDAAVTALELLRWCDLRGAGRTSDAKDRVERFADRLVRLQLPSGAFPGWVKPDGTSFPVLVEGPESAVAASVLLTLCRDAPSRFDWRDAAERCLHYLADGPVAESRWEDFETYWSCSRWGLNDHLGTKFERNGIYKQNNFSIFWCAEAFLLAAMILRDDRWLELGRRCVDELCLYQAVWDPPSLPVPAHGGFGVMNCDAEWNDARQALFATLLCAYAEATGEREYFERGLSAARAAFTMLYCPENKQIREQYEFRFPQFGPETFGFMMENVCHLGPVRFRGDGIGDFSIFTWGPGTAVAAAAELRDRYGDAYVDTAHRWACGVDGYHAELVGRVLRVADLLHRPDGTTVEVVSSNGVRIEAQLMDGKCELPLSALTRIAAKFVDVPDSLESE